MATNDTSQKDKSEGERLADALKNENELHKEHKEKEEKRHEQKVKEIRQQGGIHKLVEKADVVDELSSKVKDLRKEIKQTYFKSIYQMTTRQRVTVLEKITVRDNSVYKYDNTDETTIRSLFRKPATLEALKREIDENQVEEFEEARELISDMNMDYSSYTPVEFSAVAENSDNYIRFESNSTGKFYIYPKDEYSKEDAETGADKYRRDEYITTSTPEKLRTILRNKDEIEEAINKVEEKVKDEVETREEIHTELQSLMKKQMMMGGLVE